MRYTKSKLSISIERYLSACSELNTKFDSRSTFLPQSVSWKWSAQQR